MFWSLLGISPQGADALLNDYLSIHLSMHPSPPGRAQQGLAKLGRARQSSPELIEAQWSGGAWQSSVEYSEVR